MLVNFLKTAFRNFLRNPLFSLINLIGLSVGLASAVFILLYVFNEISYNNFHEDADRIYRVNVIHKQQDMEEMSEHSTAAMGPDLYAEFPAIENMARISYGSSGYLRVGDANHKTGKIAYADSTFFDLFSFEVLRGNYRKALSEPYSLVLTETLSQKMFGGQDPLGQVVSLNNDKELVVRAIAADPPPNSSITFDALISFSTLYLYENVFLGWDGGYAYYTYIKTQKNSGLSQIYSSLGPFLEKHINQKYKPFGVELDLYFEPLSDVHLYSKVTGGSSSIGSIYIFSAIAFFILLIACINFMNLATAKSSRRAREVGVRKVAGATKTGIRKQFLAESFAMSIAALVPALLIVELFQPAFNHLIGKELSLYREENLPLLIGLFILTIIVGILSGSYPAFYLSSFRPVHVLKGGWISPNAKSGFRNFLVVFQFIITVVLLISTIVIYKQLDFVKKKELGFNRNEVVYFPLISDNAKEKVEVLKNELRTLPFVKSTGAGSAFPGANTTRNGYFPEGYDEPVMINVIDIDEDYLRALDIELIAGNSFSKESDADDRHYLVNRALAKEFGWDNPVGKTIKRNGEHKVIGVVQDFNFAPLYTNIKPLILTNIPWDGHNYFLVRMDMGDVPAALKELENKWKQVVPGDPFVYHFLDQTIERVYGQENRYGRLFTYFTVLAVFIACLGLLGLASFMVEQRTKEIGIRKVFGSSEGEIVRLLSRDFSKLVLISILIAWPVAWFIMDMWLQRFAYRTAISWWVFVVSGIMAFGIALLTIVSQTIIAARANPAEVVKYE